MEGGGGRGSSGGGGRREYLPDVTLSSIESGLHPDGRRLEPCC